MVFRKFCDETGLKACGPELGLLGIRLITG